MTANGKKPLTKVSGFFSLSKNYKFTIVSGIIEETRVFIIPKGAPNKRYTPDFKKLAVETMQNKPWFWRTSDAGRKSAGDPKTEAGISSGNLAGDRSTAPCNLLLSSEADEPSGQISSCQGGDHSHIPLSSLERVKRKYRSTFPSASRQMHLRLTSKRRLFGTTRQPPFTCKECVFTFGGQPLRIVRIIYAIIIRQVVDSSPHPEK